MTERERAPEAHRTADPKSQKQQKLGAPKHVQRDVVDSGKHENKDTRREMREKH